MTTRFHAGILIFVAWFSSLATAQESPTETPGLTPTESLSPSPEQSLSPSPEQSPLPSPTPTPARSIPLSFVPPPMEGTISLGVFDQSGKLVRVLHREARIDNFAIEPDGLRTTWNGKNDAGDDLPPGKYRGRGYLIGSLTVKDLGKAKKMPKRATVHVPVTLTINPLVSDTRSVVDLGVGVDEKGSFIKTMDGLPLFTVSTAPHLVHALASKAGDKAVDIWQDDGTIIKQLRVSNIDQIMAFDCGFVELSRNDSVEGDIANRSTGFK